jgi:nitronate monooxygenase
MVVENYCRVFDPAELAEPVVQAPLAGGPSTVELAVAVCEAGGLGFVAAGYKSAEAVRNEIEAVRAATSRPFGVNVFVPPARAADPSAVAAYRDRLAAEAERQGVELGEPRTDDDDWGRKLELLRAERPAVASFTFGCPGAAVIDGLRSAGIAVWITVTNADEAEQARAAGADALVVQGVEAGGHRGGFRDDPEESDLGLLALLRVIANRVPLPLIAAGGIADGAAVAAVLCAGATAAQVGTALMLAPEAGTSEPHRGVLGTPSPTRLTRAFTGRTARGIVNRFLAEHGERAPSAYPEIHHVTAPLRAAARSRGDPQAINLWAGQAHELTRELPATEIVRQLGADARKVLTDVGRRLGPAE